MHVSALLLSLGEASAPDALQALQGQTLAFREIHLVEGVSPFAQAFQAGLDRVGSPFFLQCDADMVLFPHCLERLARAMDDRTALVVGHLEDSLQGPICGVKLFRTQPCREALIAAEPNCEVRQVDRLKQLGWLVTTLDEVLGSHQLPPREEAYQFERFRLLGSKSVYRQGWWDATHRLWQLSQRQHLREACAAAAGLLAGMTLGCPDQLHGRPQGSAEYTLWCAAPSPAEPPPALDASPFESGWTCGAQQRRQHSSQPRREWIQTYLESRKAEAWIFLAGYLAACLDYQQRDPAELWAQLQPWAHYLERKLHRLA